MLLKGRRQIFSSVSEVTTENLPGVLRKAFRIHEQNRREELYLHKMYRGKQDVLYRTKEVRPEINNKITENHAYEITEFKKGYQFGEPVQYVQRGKCDIHGADGEESAVSYLNELMQDDYKQTKDTELGEWLFATGHAYRMVLPGDDIPFETYIPFAPNTFVVYSSDFRHRPLLGVTYCIRDDGQKEATVYSKDTCWLVCGDEVQKLSPHVLGQVPIIEYVANPSRIGCFEPVIPMLNALNAIASDRMDGVDQFIQSLMKFINCDIDPETFRELKELGAIKITSTDQRRADVEVMTNELNQTQVQTLVDYTYQMILTICGVPDRRASAGGNTGQALIIGQGWTMAEANARQVDQMYRRSEREFLKLVLRILRDTTSVPVALQKLNLSDIDIKFSRNRTDNLLVKTEAMLNQLNAGVHPRIAISSVGLYSDPEQVWNDSQEYMGKWKVDKDANNTAASGE